MSYCFGDGVATPNALVNKLTLMLLNFDSHDTLQTARATEESPVARDMSRNNTETSTKSVKENL